MSDPCPRSAVSHGVGIAGLVGLAVWIAVAKAYGMTGDMAAVMAVVACGVPMTLWSVLVDRVHRNPTTGIDWSGPARPLADTLDISLTKLAGLWGTWAIIAGVFALSRFYWQGNYAFAMKLFIIAVPFLFVASIPYVIWLDRRLRNPFDGTWAFGSWLMGNRRADRAAIADHARSWAVKAFFTAFMLSGFAGNFFATVRAGWPGFGDPVALASVLIAVMFTIDMTLATVGYLLTVKPLDAHIRSANPHASGWVAALICYPPFVLMGPGSPLDYHQGTQEWSRWFAAHPALLWIDGTALVVLTAVYAWATVAFGIRFSNLTHRGIMTHGPYRWTKHPAYWSKNLFWWGSTLPFLATTGSWIDALRNTAILGVVSAIYWWRAKEEERHLGSDEDYRAYSAWIDRNGWWARLRRSKGYQG